MDYAEEKMKKSKYCQFIYPIIIWPIILITLKSLSQNEMSKDEIKYLMINSMKKKW